ncbi:hypothetical protein PIB30_111415, partial [Stylosanthes scabra]|nr:hypothetical protein [Stylosanthes scabra]
MTRGDRGRGRGDRGRGTGRRGRPRKRTGIPLDLGEPDAGTSARPVAPTPAPVVPTPSLAEVRKGTTKISWVFYNYYREFVPRFSMASDEMVRFWWDRWK